MTNEELAQKLADHFSPPYKSEAKKNPPSKYKHLPLEERYETIEVRTHPESVTMIVFTASDGYKPIRSLTYIEIVEALREIEKDHAEKD